MKKWKNSGIIILMTSLLAISTFSLALNIIPSVRALYSYGGYIYINPDGTFAPSAAPILKVGNTYTFSDDIYAYGIVVNRSNTVLDGNGHTLQASTSSTDGVQVITGNVTVKNVQITGFEYGVYISNIINCTISSNTMTNNVYGIYTQYCSGLNISYNNVIITGYSYGIDAYSSSRCTISYNNLTGGYYSIFAEFGSSNTFSHNNIAQGIIYGIDTYDFSSSNVSYNNVTGCGTGIYIQSGSGATVSYNNVTGSSSDGMDIWTSSNSTISYNNVTDSSSIGMDIFESSSNTISHNNVIGSSSGYGIYIYDYESSNNTLTSNVMVGNEWNFMVVGSSLTDFLNHVDASNTVNTKPIYYWINTKNAIVPLDASCVLLVNCSNILVEGLTLEQDGQGVLLAQTTNCTIAQDTIANNYYGTYLCLSSNNNTITGNTMTGNYNYDIYIDFSSGITVSHNDIIGGSYSDGIYIDYSLSSPICYNNVTGVSYGIDAYTCSGGTVSHNKVAGSYYGIYIEDCTVEPVSYNNVTGSIEFGISVYGFSGTVSYNNVTDNSEGIYISSGLGCTVSYNNVIGSSGYGIVIDSCLSSTVSHNNVTGNYYGIYTDYSLSSTISYNSVNSNIEYGIRLTDISYSNDLIGNTISNNGVGINIAQSQGNIIYHNNFVDNTVQVLIDGSPNTWDNSYPSGGNYWSDYQTLHPGASEIDSSGIWNTPYVINSTNTDHYPLMQPWSPAPVVSYLVVRGENDAIYYRLYNSTSSSWGGWNRVPDGATPDSPAAVVCSNTLYMAVRGEDNQSIYFGSINLRNNSFSGWTLLDGATPSAPTLASNGTTLALVVRGEDNCIYYSFYNIASLTWTDWASLPSGATCDSPAAAVLANHLHIVVRGMDGTSIWHCSVNLHTGAFSGWELVGGATPSRPTLTACSSLNELCLAVKGMDNATYYDTWNALGWSGWTCLQTGFPASSPTATVVGEQLQLTLRHTEAGQYLDTLSSGTIDLKTGVFSGWTLLSGATPSAPTSTS